MMKRKDFLIFLGLEVFAVIWAGAVFSLFSSRLVAGAMAGLYFVSFGLFIFYRLMKSGTPLKWATFYADAVHVFVISLPMVITRFLNADQPFDQVHILGLEGPVFHQLSTGVFSVLMVATILDAFRAKK